HVRRALVECVLCALALAGGLALVGLDTWALAAATASLSLLIPFVGPLLAVVLVFFAGLATSPTFALVSAGLVVVVVAVLRGWVSPRLLPVRRANPLVVVAAAMVLTSVLGAAGIILAPLAAAMATMVARRFVARRVVARVERDELAALAADVHLLDSVVQLADSAVPEDVRKLVDRLRLLVVEGEASLAAERRVVLARAASDSRAVADPVAVDDPAVASDPRTAERPTAGTG
ncbi:MAG: hypothetical protein JWM53_6569, partial [bacterium]|nr:hypothetical protein [bacterium]